MLEQLELILENVGALIHQQNIQDSQNDAAISASVMRSLKACENKLLILKDIVNSAKKATSSNILTRTVGSFKLSFKSKDVEEFETQLQQAISILNVTMTINLT